MAQQIINNGDTGLVARTSINSNFTELYGRNGEANTMSSLGGESLVGTKSGVNLPIKGLTAGTNITFGVGATALTINAAAAATDRIRNAADTTGLYTEETADRLVGHSAGTGTNLIFEMFEGTVGPVSVFQIDGNGNLFNNGNYQLVINSTTNLMVGTSSTHPALSGATDNTFIGYHTGTSTIAGDRNTLIGSTAGDLLSNATDCVIIGYNAGGANVGGDYNVLIGSGAGGKLLGNNSTIIGGVAGQNSTTADGVIYIGYQAGKRQTTADNILLINNYAIADIATELTDSIVYAFMDPTVANQFFKVNGSLWCTQMKSGANQGAAGASAGETWRDTADNSVKLGV